jgi:hypothetical protein
VERAEAPSPPHGFALMSRWLTHLTGYIRERAQQLSKGQQSPPLTPLTDPDARTLARPPGPPNRSALCEEHNALSPSLATRSFRLVSREHWESLLRLFPLWLGCSDDSQRNEAVSLLQGGSQSHEWHPWLNPDGPIPAEALAWFK